MNEKMDSLAALARRLLPQMLDQYSGLFAQKIIATREQDQRGGNPLYSAISVIGVLSDRKAGVVAALDTGRTIDALWTLAWRRSSSIGLRAAIVWMLVLADDHRATEGLRNLTLGFTPRDCSSMEIGLVLAALAAAADASIDDTAVPNAANAAEAELLTRFSGRAQLFRGNAPGAAPRRLLQWNITSFASQVYPVHGLGLYARASERSVPDEVTRVANRLVEMQGAYGQWWWLYSARSGRLLDGYPVYSVHQDAMAFMALATAQNLGLGVYREALERGLRWVFGENELGVSLVDFEMPFISRCIQRAGGEADGMFGMSRRQWRNVLLASWLTRTRPSASPTSQELEILHECRPYHLGWILYARSLVANWPVTVGDPWPVATYERGAAGSSC
jgi:hypothetical protein